MDMKMSLMLGMAKGFIPEVPKAGLAIIGAPKYPLSKVIIESIGEYRNELKKFSPDAYEIIMKLGMHFVMNYESNENTRKVVDESIEKIIKGFQERRAKASP